MKLKMQRNFEKKNLGVSLEYKEPSKPMNANAFSHQPVATMISIYFRLRITICYLLGSFYDLHRV